MEDPIAKGWRLLKATVSLNTHKDPDCESPSWESHPTEVIVAAQLLELIERESARRFVVHSGQKNGLLVCADVHRTTYLANDTLSALGLQSRHSILKPQCGL